MSSQIGKNSETPIEIDLGNKIFIKCIFKVAPLEKLVEIADFDYKQKSNKLM